MPAMATRAPKAPARGATKSQIKRVVKKLAISRPSRLHKHRAGWFYARVSWPLRDKSADKLHAERKRIERAMPLAPAGAGASAWESIGPSNIGGRTTSLACDPANPDRLLAGTAGGGVWKSLNAGATWSPTMHKQEHNVGALAIDPRNAKTVYCGTGEANLSADSYAGVGLYKSSNFGGSWRLIASCAKTGIPSRIGSIAIDPFDSKRLMLGGVDHNYTEVTPSSGGLFLSKDSGRHWTKLDFISTNSYWCHSVEFHPQRQGWVYAAVTEKGVKNGIWMSKDGGTTWRHLTTGLPSSDQFGRTRLAFAPSQPDTIYAIAAWSDADDLLGIFRSDDAGQTWRTITSNLGAEGQMSYGLTLAVHPQDADHVLCGGVDLHRTTNGGATWHKVTHWDAPRGDANYAHADHHALLMPAAMPGRVYDANDGGVDVSDDGGVSWANRSNGLACTMFYDLEVSKSDPGIYGGGAQDNGSILTNGGQAGAFEEVQGGDGGWMVIDPANPDYMFASSQNVCVMRRKNNKWTTWQDPMPYGMKNSERAAVWMAYITMDPSDSRVVYVGSYRMWRTKDAGTSWEPISPNLDGSTITVIEPAPADGKVIYVGTENGGIFRSVDGGASWSGNLAGATIPGRTVTRLESSPIDARQVYACIGNFGNSHVFRSDDAGSTWIDIDGGRLPDVPHRSIVVTPDMPNRVLIANDVGVFISRDQGGTWHNLTRELPAVSVVDLVYHQSTKSLYAATYGRSIWRLKL
jgi:photosystem II stability/assembly factor-like uncharacterized protein